MARSVLDEYVTALTLARWVRVNVSTMHRRLERGEIASAAKFGDRWMIPREDAERYRDHVLGLRELAGKAS